MPRTPPPLPALVLATRAGADAAAPEGEKPDEKMPDVAEAEAKIEEKAPEQ